MEQAMTSSGEGAWELAQEVARRRRPTNRGVGTLRRPAMRGRQPNHVGAAAEPGRRMWPDNDGAGAVQPPNAADGSEMVRWAQDCLNQAMDAALPVNGVMHAASRSALRSFQRREGLRPTGILGPDTREALQRACAERASEEAEVSRGRQSGATGVSPPMRAAALHRPECGIQRGWTKPAPLSAGPNLPCAAKRGIYLIRRGDKPLYVGLAAGQTIAKRLQAHIWCLNHFRVSTGKLTVEMFPMPKDSSEAIRRKEKSVIAEHGLSKEGGTLSNVRHELESPFFLADASAGYETLNHEIAGSNAMHATNCRCPVCATTGHTMQRQSVPAGIGSAASARAPAGSVPAIQGARVTASGRWVRRGPTIIILDV